MIRKMSLRPARTAAFIGALFCCASAQADVFSPYQAVYEVNRGNVMLGDTTFTMTRDKGDCYRIQGVAEPKGLAALFAGRMTEQSYFCVENGHIRSHKYSISREGGDDDDNYTLRFDWGNQLVTTDNNDPRELPAEGLDRTVMELALRQQLARHLQLANGELPQKQFVFLMVEDDEIKPYRFQVTGRETIRTPAGRFDAVKVERTNSQKRQFRLWLAPELDYLPVLLERQKKDKPAVRMLLRKLPQNPAAQNQP